MSGVTPRPFLPLLGLALAGVAAPAASQALANHNSNAPVDIDAGRLEVQDRQDRAIFSGSVTVRQAGLTLQSQRLTVVYTGGIGSDPTIQRLDASGGVTVRSASETARGNFAVYDLNRRQITVVGGVTLQQGQNRLSGGRLVIDLNSGRSVIDGSARGAAVPGPNGATTATTPGGRVTGRFNVPQRAVTRPGS